MLRDVTSGYVIPPKYDIEMGVMTSTNTGPEYALFTLENDVSLPRSESHFRLILSYLYQEKSSTANP